MCVLYIIFVCVYIIGKILQNPPLVSCRGEDEATGLFAPAPQMCNIPLD